MIYPHTATQEQDGITTRMQGKCPFCSKVWTVKAPTEQHQAFLGGALVQHAFPEMSIDDRDTVTTGMCKDCQARFHG